MASINFTPGTVIPSSWLNDVNTAVYDIIPEIVLKSSFFDVVDSVVVINSTASVTVPVGTTAQRPTTPVPGTLRYNSDLQQYEGYGSVGWAPIGGAAKGGPNNQVFFENDVSVIADYTITTNKNALSAGPITVGDGVTITIPDGSVWTIV